MEQITLLQLLTLLLAFSGAVIAVLTFRRAGRWRLSDDGKRIDTAITRLEAATESEGGVTLKQDIHKIKNDLARIEASVNFNATLAETVGVLGDRVTRVETTLQSVATSGDFRQLKAEVDGLGRDVKNTLAGVSRIEGWLVEGRDR